MCHSFVICSSSELTRALREVSGDALAEVPEGISAGGVAYPGTFAPVIVGLHEVREWQFGLPVEWKQGTVFNARLESLLDDTGMWEGALAHRRCVLPCASFYESHHSEMAKSPKTGKLVKRRYSFEDLEGAPLLLAAVYEGDAFSVVTTVPNADVEPIHDRMPLVLTVEEARRWLDPDTPRAWFAGLANRGVIHLDAQPEGAVAPPEPDQLTLPL